MMSRTFETPEDINERQLDNYTTPAHNMAQHNQFEADLRKKYAELLDDAEALEQLMQVAISTAKKHFTTKTPATPAAAAKPAGEAKAKRKVPDTNKDGTPNVSKYYSWFCAAKKGERLDEFSQEITFGDDCKWAELNGKTFTTVPEFIEFCKTNVKTTTKAGDTGAPALISMSAIHRAATVQAK